MLGALSLGLAHMSMSELKHMSEPARRVEIFTGAGRRRIWSASEKAAIVAESYSSGGTVCAVARRHGLTPQQLFTWRRLARTEIGFEDAPAFVPVVVDAVPLSSPRQSRRRSKFGGIELVIGEVEVRIGAEASPRSIAAVIRALKAAP
jgi:transposase